MKNTMRLSYPASFWTAKWRDALPTGNGKLGASVYGAVHRETVLLNHEELWADILKEPLPDISHKLPELREMMLAGRVTEAQEFLGDALAQAGYKTSIASPLPLGDLKIETPVNRPFLDYERSLDMETGEAAVTWRDGEKRFCRKLFVSRPDDLMALRFTCDAVGGLDGVALELDIHDKANAAKPLGMGHEPLPEHIDRRADGNILLFAADYPGNRDFGAVALVLTDDGELLADDAHRLTARGVTGLTVLVKLFASGERTVEQKVLRAALDALPDKDYGSLLSRHVAEHRPLFLNAAFGINGSRVSGRTNEELLLEAFRGEAPDELVEKMWAYGRYLLISSSRSEGQPCPLLGLWHGDYRAFWSFHMLNVNLQMIYWQALSGNMHELLLAVFDYYEGMMDDFRLNARNLFGCRGIYIPSVTTPGVGTIQCVASHILNWTGGAGWLCQHYYDYALHTGDDGFLRERALPFMRETAMFYRDFFILDDRGYYMAIPSVSPENSPGNYCRENFEGPEVTINATMDFAIAKEVLTNLLAGSKRLGVYADEWENWREMLCHIPPYELTEDGAVREWMHPFFEENNHHRHQSHLYPIFPGTEVTREENPALFGAFTKSLRNRLIIGLTSQTSWSQAYMACNYARMGHGDQAYGCLDNILRTFTMNNLFTVHNDWRNMGIGLDMAAAPFQIDANMGFTAAINEMLLFGKPGWLKLLPAVPARWKTGFCKGLSARGGILMDLEWNLGAGQLKATLTARRAGELRLTAPLPVAAARCSDGEAVIWGSDVELHLPAERPVTLSLFLDVPV